MHVAGPLTKRTNDAEDRLTGFISAPKLFPLSGRSFCFKASRKRIFASSGNTLRNSALVA